MAQVQKLCVNCQHFSIEFELHGELGANGELHFACDQSKYDLKGRDLKQGQFLMYMYMAVPCDKFQTIDFTGPKGRAGLPSGEQFGSGGALQMGPPLPSENS